MSTNTTYSTTSYEKLLSACGGALVTSLMVTPMDVIKMRLQTQHVYTPNAKAICCLTFDRCTLTQAIKTTKKNFSSRGKVQVANLHECALQSSKNPELFKGTFDGIYKICKYEGVAALWKGLSPALLMSVPANIIYFVGYDYLRDIIQPFSKFDYADYSPLLAGAIARTVAVTLISPIELFRTRLQATATTDVNDFKHVLNGVKNMVSKDGSRALWRGLPPTLWRDVPFSAVYWMGYEQCKNAIELHNQHYVALTDLQITFAAGALSGMFAAAITTPFDVAKTRRQVDVGRDIPSLRASSVPGILKQIYQQDGFRGLFRGLTPRVAKIGPSCAIMISSYEMGKVFFSKQRE